MTDLAHVVASIRERVTPGPEERAALAEAVERLTARTREAVADLPIEAEVLQVGSTARGTWLSGDRDIDLFVRFPTDVERPDLERYGLAVGRAVLPAGHEEYAEHPYVTGTFEGFDVDLVPCYDVESAGDIRSAVDRTPFHTAYLEARFDEELAGEARVFKQFLKGIGVYGSDLRTRGFSGYLAELLVLEYGGVDSLLRAAADWHPPVDLDPEGHRVREFDDPLVVVDPTDPGRNVAAVCAAENVARFQHHARDLLADPRASVFFPDPPAPLDADAVREHLDRRRTTPVAVVFDAPDLVDDQLYPQLRRSLAGVTGLLERREFGPLRSTLMAAERAVLLVELTTPELPAVERHEGPPVAVREHAAAFYGTYADDPDAYGPFVDGDRYVVERPREQPDAAALLRSDALFDAALGAAVETALEAEYDVLVGDAVATLAAEFGTELARYFDPGP